MGKRSKNNEPDGNDRDAAPPGETAPLGEGEDETQRGDGAMAESDAEPGGSEAEAEDPDDEVGDVIEDLFGW